MMKIYETNRLHLREIDESYAEKVLQYYDRNREFLKPGKSIDQMIFSLDYQKKSYKRIEKRSQKVKSSDFGFLKR